jgi:hypothetical protein
MVTAKYYPILFQTMAYDSHSAMRAGRGEHLNCTLEAIKSVGFVRSDNLKRFIVVIPASITFRHEASYIDTVENGSPKRAIRTSLIETKPARACFAGSASACSGHCYIDWIEAVNTERGIRDRPGKRDIEANLARLSES